MGQVRVGTASWTDRTLIESGWYPPEANNPEKRLRYYARQFPLVEVDATYYALPAEQTARAWAERTPPGFTFNIKAFSLFTQHPTPVRAFPADLREAAGSAGEDRVYLKDVDPAGAEAAWDRFLGPPGRLRAAGRAGPGVRGNPQPDLDDRGQPAGDAGLPGLASAPVRVRGHAAGLPALDPAGAGRHQPPARAPDARA